MRGGVRVEIPSADVVPGDIVLLEAGDMVVADGRVLENFSLKVNESSRHRRERGRGQDGRGIDADQVPWATRRTWCSPAAFVTYGRARFLVTSTGMHTEMAGSPPC